MQVDHKRIFCMHIFLTVYGSAAIDQNSRHAYAIAGTFKKRFYFLSCTWVCGYRSEFDIRTMSAK
jgi:hypothetical protein